MDHTTVETFRTATPAEKRHIQHAVFQAWRSRLDEAVAHLPASVRSDGLEEATIGLLMAVELFDPATSPDFEAEANASIAREVARWAPRA